VSVVLYCGDPHGEFGHIIRAVEELCASAVVLLGDLEPARPLHEELDSIASKVWFIHGNHDTDSDSNGSNVWESQLADRNIHGRVVTLPDGTRLAGLGGVFRESVWYPSLATPPKSRTPEEQDCATPRWDQWRAGRPRKVRRRDRECRGRDIAGTQLLHPQPHSRGRPTPEATTSC
jgi:hypothetical protein